MPRGAAVVYPKDAAQIVAMADIFPGAHVVEAGVGSGALTCSLLRAVGPHGPGVVVRAPRGVRRRRPAQRHPVLRAASHPAWSLTVGDLAEALPAVGRAVRPGDPGHARALGVPRRGRRTRCGPAASSARTSPPPPSCRAFVETRPRRTAASPSRSAWESLVRDWHVEGLAVRPGHSMIGHTAFLVTARRMAPGERPAARSGVPRPAPTAPDYTGPRPPTCRRRWPRSPSRTDPTRRRRRTPGSFPSRHGRKSGALPSRRE